MSAQHSAGLLSVAKAKHGATGYVVAIVSEERGDRCLVLEVPEGDETQDDENARRLATCWNACDGIDTDLLEQIPSIVGSTLTYRVLRKQHADLLIALQALHSNMLAQDLKREADRPTAADYESCMRNAAHAIAQATGEVPHG